MNRGCKHYVEVRTVDGKLIEARCDISIEDIFCTENCAYAVTGKKKVAKYRPAKRNEDEEGPFWF